MAGRFMHMVSMERTPEEKAADREASEYPPPISAMPDVPPGLCICLTETELEKLGFDIEDVGAECRVGDVIHLVAFARVTSISTNDTGGGTRGRLELAITDLEIEDETEEGEQAA